MSAPRRPSLLLAVDDPEVLDLLTRVFEARGFAIATASTARQAISHLEGERVFEVVVASWDEARPLGGEVYKWVLAHQIGLRARFVFLADEPPAELDRVVAGRCLTLRPDDVEEVVRIVDNMVRRARRRSTLPHEQAMWLDDDRPALLLVDDDTTVLKIMAQMLGDVGFTVTSSESGNAAIAQLARGEFAVVVIDWYMPDGSGAEVYRWLLEHQPDMLDRLVILTGGEISEVQQIADGVPVVPKGQDFATLLGLIASTAQQAKRAS